MRMTLTLLLFLALATPAFASDGVLEINQTCAVNTGCFAGDGAGLPVTIDGSAGRSYRLTSDLTVPNVNTSGIVVSTSSISIDLNGFEIAGPVTCSGSPVTCTPAFGTGGGVTSSSTTNRGISVKNGSITGMGTSGVLLYEQTEVTNLRVSWNRVHGIFTGDGSTISGNTAYQNGGNGIQVDPGTIVLSNAAYQNGLDGIYAGAGSIVSGNTAYNNGSDGIYAAPGSTVHGNAVRANLAFGLNLVSTTTYRENTITLNATGTVTGAGAVNMGDNYCTGNGTVSANCP